MRIKVDEDLPRRVVHLLAEYGYDVRSVYDQGMSGWKDSDLFVAVQKEGRFLITGDKGFGDIRAYPPGQHAGILVLRPAKPSIPAFVELLQRVLQEYDLETFHGCLVVVTPNRLRVRKPNLTKK